MEKQGHARKNLKLSETDKKVLLSYINTSLEQITKPKIETAYDNKSIKLL